MPPQTPNHPDNGNPTAADIFRVFRDATMASISGMRLLLGECVDLRTELVAVHSLHGDGDGHGQFSARQRTRIVELQEAAKHMEDVLVSLHGTSSDHLG